MSEENKHRMRNAILAVLAFITLVAVPVVGFGIIPLNPTTNGNVNRPIHVDPNDTVVLTTEKGWLLTFSNIISIEVNPPKDGGVALVRENNRTPAWGNWDYFESGYDPAVLSFNKQNVRAGNSGNHELQVTLGADVQTFEYISSGKNKLNITAANPETQFLFSGSGEQSAVIAGIKNASQVKNVGSAELHLDIKKE